MCLRLFYCITTLDMCSCFDVCWSFSVVGLGWYPCSRLQNWYTDIVELGRPRMTVLRMRIECWISKATDAHSEHAIVIALLPQQWLHERAAVWYVHRLSCRSCPEGPAAPRKEIFRPKSEPANLWDACPNGTWKDSLSHGIRFCPNSVSIPLPDRSLYVVKYMRTC